MQMKRTLNTILILLGAVLLFSGLVWTKMYIAAKEKEKSEQLNRSHIANIQNLLAKIKGDSLYEVKDAIYRDSAVLVAVGNPDKSGTEAYFDKKYRVNSYDNINMVFIYQYDSATPLQTVSFEDALMAKGKKLGKFQDEWVSRFIDTLDGSCKPLNNYLKARLYSPASFKNQETVYQPANIHKMQVICKFRSVDSSGAKILNQVTALIDSAGTIISVDSLNKAQ
jgi:hypothetical protein